jgi:hypothetical protein
VRLNSPLTYATQYVALAILTHYTALRRFRTSSISNYCCLALPLRANEFCRDLLPDEKRISKVSWSTGRHSSSHLGIRNQRRRGIGRFPCFPEGGPVCHMRLESVGASSSPPGGSPE